MTLDTVSPRRSRDGVERQLSPEQGLELTGPGGLLKLFTKNVFGTPRSSTSALAREQSGDASAELARAGHPRMQRCPDRSFSRLYQAR